MSALVTLLLVTDVDSSAVREIEREETALEEGEPGLVLDDEPRGTGRFVIAGGASALRTSWAWRRFGFDLLLAREPGEPRLVDDAHARLVYQVPSWTVALGRVQVERGMTLGAPRVGTPAPSLAAREGLGGLSSTPSRAASGFTGLWVEHRRGSLRAGVLLARTQRDARAVGDALLPLAGVRHRDAHGDSARGALREDAVALSLGAGPAWLVLAHANATSYRVPPSGATAAEQRSARIVDGAAVLEVGARSRPAPAGLLETALALDAHGRARTGLALELRAPRARTVLVFESEASGFVPLRARPEHRPHAHAGVLVRGGAFRMEAHAVERRAFEPARLWMSVRYARGATVEVRRDADPVRTLIAFSMPVARGAIVASEWRFDRHGLARETWRARAFGRLPAGFDGGIELRFSGARTTVSWLDAEVPGGAWAGAGSATERARLELGRPGRVEPRVSWVRTRTAAGTRSEARLAVTWSTRKETP